MPCQWLESSHYFRWSFNQWITAFKRSTLGGCFWEEPPSANFKHSWNLATWIMEEKPEDLTIITSFKLFLLNFHEFPSHLAASSPLKAMMLGTLHSFPSFPLLCPLCHFSGEKTRFEKIGSPLILAPWFFWEPKDPREDPLGYGRAPN